jgi:ribosomal protein L29
MKPNLKNLRKKDLQSKLTELYLDLMKNNAQRSTGTQSKGNIKQIRKNIARIKTQLKHGGKQEKA